MALIFSKWEGQSHLLRIRRSGGQEIGQLGRLERISNNCNQLLITDSIFVNINLTINKQKHLLVTSHSLNYTVTNSCDLLSSATQKCPCPIRSAAENGALGLPPVRALNHSKLYRVTVHLQREAPMINISSKGKCV